MKINIAVFVLGTIFFLLCALSLIFFVADDVILPLKDLNAKMKDILEQLV